MMCMAGLAISITATRRSVMFASSAAGHAIYWLQSTRQSGGVPLPASRVDHPLTAQGDEERKRRKRGPQLADDQALDVGELAEGQPQPVLSTMAPTRPEARTANATRLSRNGVYPHVCQFRQQEGGH